MSNANVADISVFEQLQIDQNNRTNISQMTMFNNKDTAVNNTISIDPKVPDRIDFTNIVMYIDGFKDLSPAERKEKLKASLLPISLKTLERDVERKERALASLERDYNQHKTDVPLMKKELAKIHAYMKEVGITL
jgi:hypothetical protein